MMTIQEELESFHRFAAARLQESAGPFSLDDLFALWRTENPAAEDYAENVAAIQAAYDDFLRGDRGKPAGELTRQLRAELEPRDEG